MAGNREKFSLIFEAQDAASAKIKKLNNQLARLGGPKMVKARSNIRRLERQIGTLSDGTKKSNVIFSRFTSGIAAGNLIAMAAQGAMKLLGAAIGQIGKAVMIAANVQELGAVLNFVGQRAGYTATQIKFYQDALRESGIAQKETNQAMLRAIQGNIDLADAYRIGRIAQDAATIGQVDSSTAFQTLIDAIVKGRVVMLKSLGIQGTFEAQYKKLAKTLGKTQSELTEVEKKTARLNLVFEGGKIIAGAYETAMGFASKRLRSMPRLVQDLQVAFGTMLTPALDTFVTTASTTIKSLTSIAKWFAGATTGVFDFKEEIKKLTTELKEGNLSIDDFNKRLSELGTDTGKIKAYALSYGLVMDEIARLNEEGKISASEFAKRIVEEQAKIPRKFLAGVIKMRREESKHLQHRLEEWTQFYVTMDTIAEKAANSDVKGRLAKSLSAMTEVALAAEGTIEEIEEAHVTSVTAMAKTASASAKFAKAAGDKMVSILGNGIGQMVDGLVSGRNNMGEIFKGMAQDFMAFFIKQALAMALNMFVPGLGSILGSMFDTPTNDRMAAAQGGDFMRFFIAGALAEAQGGTTLAVGITSSGNLAPNIMGSGSSGSSSGMVVMNITISGNVMTDSFIEDTVAPKLNRLINDGRSLIEVQPENITGGRNVRTN